MSKFEAGNVVSLSLLLKHRVQDASLLRRLLCQLPKLKDLTIRHRGTSNFDPITRALDSIPHLVSLSLFDQSAVKFALDPNRYTKPSSRYETIFDDRRLPSLKRLNVRGDIPPTFILNLPSTLERLSVAYDTPCVILTLLERLADSPNFLAHQERTPFNIVNALTRNSSITATEHDFAMVGRQSPRLNEAAAIVERGVEALRARGVVIDAATLTTLETMVKTSFAP